MTCFSLHILKYLIFMHSLDPKAGHAIEFMDVSSNSLADSTTAKNKVKFWKIWKKRFGNRNDNITALNCAPLTEAIWRQFVDYFARFSKLLEISFV